MRFTISLPKRLGLFVLVAFLCFVITSLLIGFVIKIFGMTEPSTRILAVIQDHVPVSYTHLRAHETRA